MPREDSDDRAIAAEAKELLARAQAEVASCSAFLDWLALVSRAHRTTFHANERIHAYREGRRSLYFDVLKLMELKPEHLGALGERKRR